MPDQTKYLQQCIDSIEQKLSLIMEHFNIQEGEDAPPEEMPGEAGPVSPRKKMVDELTAPSEGE